MKNGIQKVQIIWRRISSIPSKLKAVWENFKATVLAIGKKLTSSKQKLTEIKEILLEEIVEWFMDFKSSTASNCSAYPSEKIPAILALWL